MNVFSYGLLLITFFMGPPSNALNGGDNFGYGDSINQICLLHEVPGYKSMNRQEQKKAYRMKRAELGDRYIRPMAKGLSRRYAAWDGWIRTSGKIDSIEYDDFSELFTVVFIAQKTYASEEEGGAPYCTEQVCTIHAEFTNGIESDFPCSGKVKISPSPGNAEAECDEDRTIVACGDY